MNARPYIFGCLCLVGATGTAAASDIDPISGLFSAGGNMSSSFDSSAGRSQGGTSHDSSATGSDVMSTRPGGSSGRASNGGGSPATSSASGDVDDSTREGPAPVRAPVPSWQSLLPGSML
ncbi:hypothetical protein [Luteibacter yeojuensis]|uniref:Uncharacterized protein n=1 Tax=Luteibacter yeojuensis TaxID=345309 RepID=A0A0F3KZK7_9GAMM|nr:hypothetical protein [Luteibacter yeojuensis]KJV36715.1 hypothetical protein VI08_02790 [Luteibacter yeojuensis]